MRAQRTGRDCAVRVPSPDAALGDGLAAARPRPPRKALPARRACGLIKRMSANKQILTNVGGKSISEKEVFIEISKQCMEPHVFQPKATTQTVPIQSDTGSPRSEVIAEQTRKSSEPAPIMSGAWPAKSPDVLAEKFLELAYEHRKLKLQTFQLQYEIEFAIRLLHKQPNQDGVVEPAVKRLDEALQKFKVEEALKQNLDVELEGPGE